jgi:hypothetical protein
MSYSLMTSRIVRSMAESAQLKPINSMSFAIVNGTDVHRTGV